MAKHPTTEIPKAKIPTTKTSATPVSGPFQDEMDQLVIIFWKQKKHWTQ